MVTTTLGKQSDIDAINPEFHARLYKLMEQTMAMSASRAKDLRDRKLISGDESFTGITWIG